MFKIEYYKFSSLICKKGDKVNGKKYILLGVKTAKD